MLRVVVVVLLVACGDNKPPITFEEYREARRDAACEWNVRCGYLPNVETCVGLFPVTMAPNLVAAIDAKLTVFHPDAAYRCVKWLESVGCDPTTAEYRQPACFGIYTGTLPDGEPCAFGAECISGECFHEGSERQCEEACCRGVCAGNTPATLGKIGDRCRYSDCIEGYCDGNLCLAYKPEGATCERGGECDLGLSCVIDNCERWPCAGTCMRLPGAGEPCDGRCREAGQTCGSSSGVCERWRLGGERCVVPSDCSPYFECSADHTNSYSCRARGGGLGASCFGAFAVCTPPYVCDSSTYTCTEPKAVGEPCRSDEECASSTCDRTEYDSRDWTCAPYAVCI